jgi:hypothetical protein
MQHIPRFERRICREGFAPAPVAPASAAQRRAELCALGLPADAERAAPAASKRDAGAVEDVRSHADALLADALVISVKTVGIHASHFLRKLDVPTRIQAAAISHRVGPRPPARPSKEASASEAATQ